MVSLLNTEKYHLCQNTRRAELEWHLWIPCRPTLSLNGLHNLSGQPVSMLKHPHRLKKKKKQTKTFSYV